MFEKKYPVPELLKEFNKVFNEKGFKAYLVGGAVRDFLMGKEAHDWDVATDAKPEQVMNLFRFVIPTGITHGTVTVHFKNVEIEVTTFRTESDYSDGRHPDKVEFAATIEEDLSRRDFTMNAIAVDLSNGKIVDPFNGQKDIKNKIIKTVGKAQERFQEDGLRPVRAVRFAGKLGFTIEKETFEEISKPEQLKKISSISLERFRDEFEKILSSAKPSESLKLLEQTGILKIFIPELVACRGCIQSDYRAFHEFDVLDHLFYACDGAPADKLNIRLSALFHDIGKLPAKSIKTVTVLDGDKNDGSTKTVDTITFYNHEVFSEKITKEVLTRLKFSNEMISNVCHLVKEHMFHYESNWSDAAVRRFIVRADKDCISDLYDLRLADVYGMHNQKVDVRYSETAKNLIEMEKRIQKVLAENDALSLKELAVNGNDLMKVGIPAGKQLGVILNNLMETVIEDPSLNVKEKLLEIGIKIYRENCL